MKKIFLLLSATLFICCANKEPQKQDIPQDAETQQQKIAYENQYLVQAGDMAPDFEMLLPSGEKVKLSSLRGKIVMLQFTASWCGVCRKEMPHIESEIWQKYKDNEKFALYGIDRDEPAETVLKFAETTGVTYPIGLDPDGDIFGLYAEKDAGITRNIIIDKEGRIVMLTRLFEEEEFNHMVELINELLAN